jgi:hypothetical protein
MPTDFIEWAPTSATDPDGFFTDPATDAVFFDEPTTAWTSTFQFPAGTYYFHVAAYDPATCDAGPASCVEEFSEPVGLSVPPDPPSPPPPPPDTLTSFSALRCSASQRVGNLTVQAGMAENGTITVLGNVNVPNASRVYKLKPVSVTASAGKSVTIKVKLPAPALQAAKKAFKRHRKVRANLTIAARDTAGNVKTEKRSVKLRR